MFVVGDAVEYVRWGRAVEFGGLVRGYLVGGVRAVDVMNGNVGKGGSVKMGGEG